jgi:hypothetical protein
MVRVWGVGLVVGDKGMVKAQLVRDYRLVRAERVGLVVGDKGMVGAQHLDSVVRDNGMVRAHRIGLVLRKIEFVLVELSRIGTGCVEKRMFVADFGLQKAVGVVEVGEPS